MNSKQKEEPNEQYEEIMLALLLNEHAEQQGEELLREFEEACAGGEIPEVPFELDQKCRKLIEQKKKEIIRRELFIRSFQTIGRVAAMLLIVLGVCTTLVLSVEAIRTPIVNLLLEQHEEFSTIGGIKDQTGLETDSTNPINGIFGSGFADLSIDNIVPEGYACVVRYEKSKGGFYIAYMNSTGSLIVLESFCGDSIVNADTENAESQPVSIGDYDGLYIIKGERRTVVWYMPENEQFYRLRADAMEEIEFWALVDSVMTLLREVK